MQKKKIQSRVPQQKATTLYKTKHIKTRNGDTHSLRFSKHTYKSNGVLDVKIRVALILDT